MEAWQHATGRDPHDLERRHGHADAALQRSAVAGGDIRAGLARALLRQGAETGAGGEKVMRPINVALIGYQFMGKAHSNAYRQVGRFFSPRLTPRMKVICGRTPSKVRAAARTFGWDEAATDWRAVVARKDIDLVAIS